MKNYKFSINGHTYDVLVKSVEDNLAQVEVNGTPYEVTLEKEVKTTKTPKLVRAKTPQPTAAPKPLASNASISKIDAPLPGIILDLLVKEGDVVKKEDTLLIMEAMKMENKVLAEKGGTIKSIKIKVGDNVLQGQLLIEIE
ncbi:biotin/lipoyl-containing protein [Chondrinema litorale]|uniref:biotin/lipoyl-containing protein n=1 Tax=Chondrinema litorale TaxID=2994555 RepID=UPI00254342FB|nr:biotin/lipoyl-containing protein [Chondrinema litorale]UZR92853.1 biotin/lipoyl-binding protein [Chondrinema litorale]